MVEQLIINEEYYEKIIEEAKHIISGVAENIQESTLHQYKKVVKRLILSGQTPIQNAKSKGSYYTYRAAWVGYHSNFIREQLQVLDLIKKNDFNRWQNEVKGLQYFIDQLKVCKPDPKRKQRQLAIEYDQSIKAGITPSFDYSNEWRVKSGQEKIVKVDKSKKSFTRKLPTGWREKIFQAAYDKHSRHTLAIALMICTGCRPKELQNGINLQLNEKTGEISFVITSAKSKNEAFEIRQFTLKNESMAFRYLASQLRFNKGQLQLRDVKYKAASTEVGRLSKQALNLRKEQVSAYCFRHAFSGDLHAAGLNRIEIAQCLGHSTDETQAYYSYSTKHASGAFKIENIDSTEAVKELTQNKIDTLLRKIKANDIESNLS